MENAVPKGVARIGNSDNALRNVAPLQRRASANERRPGVAPGRLVRQCATLPSARALHRLERIDEPRSHFEDRVAGHGIGSLNQDAPYLSRREPTARASLP